jgi:anti-sigma factor RsiW
MRCEEVQDLASAWLDQELPEPRAGQVAEHEASCDACHGYIADLRSLSEQMSRMGRTPAPPGLEEKIRALLADQAGVDQPGASVVPFRARSSWRAWPGVQYISSLAAVCLLSIFGTWAVMRPPSVDITRHDVVAAHVRSLLQNSTIQVVSSDQHTVRPWFAGKVEFAPPVKDLTAEGFPLVGGRLDYVDNHRVATLVYRHGPHTISVFVWPEGANQAAAPPPMSVEGLNVLSWTKDGMVCWAVSDMDLGELKELRTLL